MLSKTEMYTGFDGGITEKSIEAWHEFRRNIPLVSHGFQPGHVVCNPVYPVTIDGHTSPEHVVMLTFETKDGGALLPERCVLAVDGFSWGYGGEGPRGLATVLADIMGTFSLALNTPGLVCWLIGYVSQRHMDRAWSESIEWMAKQAISDMTAKE